jgi:hypothetical protein
VAPDKPPLELRQLTGRELERLRQHGGDLRSIFSGPK